MSSYQPDNNCSGFAPVAEFGSPSRYGRRVLTDQEEYRRGKYPFRELVYHGHVPKFVKKLKTSEDLKRVRPGHTDGSLEANETLRRHQEEMWLLAVEEDPTIMKEVCPVIANKVKAVLEKVKGNEAFKSFDYATAIVHYTKCIELDPLNEVYYSNRSAAYQSLGAFEQSMQDAEKVVGLNPDWMKGWGRLAVTQYKLGLYRYAKVSYEKALALRPKDRMFIEGLEKVLKAEQLETREKREEGKRGKKRAGVMNDPDDFPAEKRPRICQEGENKDMQG